MIDISPAVDARRHTWSALARSSFPPFVLLYLALFGAFGTESPFFPSFLGLHGLSSSEIGIVLSVGTVVRLSAGPFVGMGADRYGPRRTLALTAVGAGGFILLYLASTGFWPLLVVCMIHSVAIAPLNPLADALALIATAREKAFAYGWVRGAGSIGFIIGTLASGVIVARFGLDSIIIAASILFLLMVVPIPRLPPTAVARPAIARGAILRLLAVPRFRHMLVVAGLVIGSHAMSDAFAVIHWRRVGIGADTIGVLWSTAVASEILVFVVLGPLLLRRLGPARCAALAAAAGVLRWGVLAQTTVVAALAATQLLHGLTFALLHLACMQIIGETIPEELSATAQTLYGTFCLGISSAALTFLSGELYAVLGAHAFWSMALLCAAALPIAFSLPRGSDPIWPNGRTSSEI